MKVVGGYKCGCSYGPILKKERLEYCGVHGVDIANEYEVFHNGKTNNKIKVQLKGDHPHAGELAYLFVNENGSVTLDEYNMVELFLINCEHGQEGCYAERKDFDVCGGGKK